MKDELIDLKREIRDLKTAQTVPSIMKLYSESISLPNGLTKGFHYWTIHYDETENQTEPITYDNTFILIPEFFDSATNTQKIVIDAAFDGAYAGAIFLIYSTRPITSITQDS